MKRAAPRRAYALGVLTLTYAFNFVDRSILGILAPSIAADLGFQRTEIGLLTGFYFALFYTGLGLPIALYADRANRKVVVGAALMVWSGFTLLSGFVTSFFWLALARIGVAVGEAGGSPPSHAMISDLYGPRDRGRALGLYSLGIPFGIMVAYFTAAALSTTETTNWRAVFVVLGVPGVLLAVLLLLTVQEPERGRLDAAGDQLGLWQAVSRLARYPSYWLTALGLSFASFAGYALGAFLIDFARAAFPEVSVARLLVLLGLLNGTLYAAGTYAGGALADRWARRTSASYALVGAVAALVAAPALVAAVWAQSFLAFLAFVAVNVLAGGFYLAPSFSVAQNLAPPQLRAVSTAVFFFVLNLIALGGGPTLTGALADVLGTGREVWFVPFSAAIAGAVGGGLGEVPGYRWALSTLGLAYVLGALSWFFAARLLPRDLARARGEAP